MNSKQQKTLQAVFNVPPPKDLDYSMIKSLLLSIGASILEGNGSRVRFDYREEQLLFHKPHNPNTFKLYQVKQIKDFLTKIGITP